MKPGDKVMVPRTGGGYSLGEILEIYTDRARVTFPIGNTFRGKPRPLVGMGYKTVKLSELRPTQREEWKSDAEKKNAARHSGPMKLTYRNYNTTKGDSQNENHI